MADDVDLLSRPKEEGGSHPWPINPDEWEMLEDHKPQTLLMDSPRLRTKSLEGTESRGTGSGSSSSRPDVAAPLTPGVAASSHMADDTIRVGDSEVPRSVINEYKNSGPEIDKETIAQWKTRHQNYSLPGRSNT